MERRGFFLRILFLALVVPAVFFLTSDPSCPGGYGVDSGDH